MDDSPGGGRSARPPLTPSEIDALAECLLVVLVPKIMRAVQAANENAELSPPKRAARAAAPPSSDVKLTPENRKRILRKLVAKGLIEDVDE